MEIPKQTLCKVYSSCVVESAMWAFTSAPVCRYFMTLLGDQYPQTCNTILGCQTSCQVALAAIVQASVSWPFITSKIDCLKWFKNNFGILILLDSIIFTVISLLSEECVLIRFLGFAIFSTVTSQIWGLVSNNQFNLLLSGESLTRFNARLSCIRQTAAFAGGLLLIVAGDLVGVHTYIAIQCIGIWSIAVLDYSTFTDIEEILEK